MSEVEGLGLTYAMEAFQNLLKGNYFEAIVDHSALIHIVKSKHEPPTMRLKKIVEKLSGYSFELKFCPGSQLKLPDFLSRQSNAEDLEKLLRSTSKNIGDINDYQKQAIIHVPIAMLNSELKSIPSSSTSSDGADISPPLANMAEDVRSDVDNEIMCEKSTESIGSIFGVKTRAGSSSTPAAPVRVTCAYAKSKKFDLSVDLSKYPSERKRRSADQRVHTPRLPPIQELGNEEPELVMPRPADIQRIHTRNSTNNDRSTNEVPLDVPRTSLIEQINKRQTSSKADNLIEGLNSRRGELSGDKEIEHEHTSKIPAYKYRESKSILPDLESRDIILKKYPRQVDIDRMLESITKRCITNFHLPLSQVELKQEQQRCPVFKEMYNYLSCGILPNKKSKSKSIIRQSDNYLLADGILFKIDFKGDEDFKLTLCVPDELVPIIIEKHHSEVYCSHQGVTRTYLAIRKNYFCHNLFDRVAAYIRACINCEQRKDQSHNAKNRPVRPRIYGEYKPFAELHIDVKNVGFTSYDGFKNLLVCVCPLTRYVVLIPIRNMDAITIAEAILQRIVFTFGKPKVIVSDLAKGFDNKLVHHIYKALKINARYISPQNHASCLAERSIGTVSRMLLSHLTGHGRNWSSVCQAVAFSHNATPLTHLDHISPFELAFGREPNPIVDLHVLPLPQAPVHYREYLETLQNKFKTMGKVTLDIQNKSQMAKSYEAEQKVMEKNKFIQGQLVYFMCPQASDLQTNTLKFKCNWVGPLVINTILDTHHVILEDLEGNLLYGTHSIHRIKSCHLATPKGVAGNIRQLREGFKGHEMKNISLDKFKFVDDEGNTMDKFTPDKALFIGKIEDSDSLSSERLALMWENRENNRQMAVPEKVSDKGMNKLEIHVSKSPLQHSDLEVTKTRYKDGHLQLLFSHGKFAIWLYLFQMPNLYDRIEGILDILANPNSKIKTTGRNSREICSTRLGEN